MSAKGSLINHAAVREYALGLSSAKLRGFDRVSAEFFRRVDAAVRRVIEREVSTHPSIGKTLK